MKSYEFGQIIDTVDLKRLVMEALVRKQINLYHFEYSSVYTIFFQHL